MSSRKPPDPPAVPPAGEGRPRSRRSRTLREEEARLWSEVTKSLKPLRRPRRQPQPGPDPVASAATENPPATAPAATGKDGQQRLAPRHGKASHDSLPVQRRVPDLTGFTRRDMRQLTTGRHSIEARLDLHGLRQAEAHMALRGFLLQCQDQGLKRVLVITGKGGGYNREEALFGRDEPGVLRRLVPIWLAEPGLRNIVTGFAEAPLRHGGAGALFVRLRARRERD